MQHFLLSAAARTLTLKAVFRMGEDKAYRTFCELRWPENDGEAVCPRCGCTESYNIATRRKFKCVACNHQFSVTSGTIFASRKLSFTDLLAAIVIFVNGAKGIAALHLSRDLGCQYKTAFVLSHKLREAMAREDAGRQLSGEVETDGAYFGGYVKPLASPQCALRFILRPSSTLTKLRIGMRCTASSKSAGSTTARPIRMATRAPIRPSRSSPGFAAWKSARTTISRVGISRLMRLRLRGARITAGCRMVGWQRWSVMPPWQRRCRASGRGIGSGRTKLLKRNHSISLKILEFLPICNSMDRAVAIANEFLRKPGGHGLTQMQLQKLVYFSHGWSLGLTGCPLTIEQPEAWDYGPVYSDLYDHTKLFGRGPIGREITPDDDEPARFFGRAKSGTPPYRATLAPVERNIVDQVWARYGSLTGARLSALTHQPNTPWSRTHDGVSRNRQIDNELIRQHYVEIAQRASAGN